MDYYPEEYDYWNDEPLPEDLIEEAIDENGYLEYSDRIMVIMELSVDVSIILGQRTPPTLRDRIADRWAIDHDDFTMIREDMDMIIEGR